MKTPIVLRQALPYIQKYSGKIVILKFSGKNLSGENFGNIVQDISVLHALNIHPIIVHGAGPQIEKKLPKKSLKIRGLRVTSSEEIQIMEQLVPKMSEGIIEEMEQWDLSPKNFSKEIFSLRAKNFPNHTQKHYTGDITAIDIQSVEHAILNGKIPVFSSLLFDEDENPYNVNADEIAVHIAVSMRAKKLIFFSDVQGVLDLEKKIISTIPLKKITQLEDQGIISGGMIPKLEACRTAIEGGVGRCHIVSGLEDGATLKEIFTVEGIGTMVLEDMSEYRHIRLARPDDAVILKNIAEENNFLECFTDVHQFFVFEIDGQIVGYISKQGGIDAVVNKKFHFIEIEKMLESYRDKHQTPL